MSLSCLDVCPSKVLRLCGVPNSRGGDSYPEPFPCVIKARSQATEALIRANGNEDEDDVLDLNQV